jgi:hypothetical protein
MMTEPAVPNFLQESVEFFFLIRHRLQLNPSIWKVAHPATDVEFVSEALSSVAKTYSLDAAFVVDMLGKHERGLDSGHAELGFERIGKCLVGRSDDLHGFAILAGTHPQWSTRVIHNEPGIGQVLLLGGNRKPKQE